ncbi:hypothetical protein MMC09_002521 [Bachmanniomyces sp. S44760]|nr:hypothetical protein [Bachmanniomyces sp. S44760]
MFREPSPALNPLSSPNNDENSPRTSEKRTLYGEDLPPSPVNILQEISNSTRRKRPSTPRPALSTIFQDSTAANKMSDSISTSWYNETSNNPSPCPHEDGIEIATRLPGRKSYETTLSHHSSPAAKSTKSPRRQGVAPRTASIGSSRYIEHLESQLASLTTKLNALTSPTSSKAHLAKLRALTTDNRSLRQEISEWESKFDERVKADKDDRCEVEADLKTRLRALEEDNEIKESKIHELADEVELVHERMRDAESLEQANVHLERRIDALTGLLTRSPSKHSFEISASPLVRADPQKQTARPHSMYERAPSAPRSRLSSNFGPDAGLWSPKKNVSLSISEDPEEPVQLPPEPEPVLEAYSRLTSHQSPRHVSNESLDTTSSYPSGPPSSRPTSLFSNSSMSASGPTTAAVSNEATVRSVNRARKTRRFQSSSGSLKPLILPTTTVISSLPASAPVYGYDYIPKQGASSDLLQHANSCSPTSQSPLLISPRDRRGSSSWIQSRQQGSSIDEAFSPTDTQKRELDDVYHDPEKTFRGSREFSFRQPSALNLHGQNLMAELALAESNAATEGSESCSPPHQLDRQGGNPLGTSSYGAQYPARSTSVVVSRPRGEGARSSFLHRRATCGECEVTPKASPEKVSTESRSLAGIPTALRLTPDIYNVFDKLVILLLTMRQDPLFLAKKMLYNMWTISTSSLGGLGWWLLGLLLGSDDQGKERRKADDVIVEEEHALDESGFDWHFYSAEASKQRRAELFLQKEDRENHSVTARSGGCDDTQKGPYDPLERYRCKDCIEPSSRQSLRLWFRFSLAIVLAVGVAVKDGPGALLVQSPIRSKRSKSVASKQDRNLRQE